MLYALAMYGLTTIVKESKRQKARDEALKQFRNMEVIECQVRHDSPIYNWSKRRA